MHEREREGGGEKERERERERERESFVNTWGSVMLIPLADRFVVQP